jgi:hypothetical protein
MVLLLRLAGAKRSMAWSVVIAVDLLVERLGIKGLGRTANTGDDQQGNKGGRDGLHGNFSSHLIWRSLPTIPGLGHPRSRAGELVVAGLREGRCSAGNTFAAVRAEPWLGLPQRAPKRLHGLVAPRKGSSVVPGVAVPSRVAKVWLKYWLIPLRLRQESQSRPPVIRSLRCANGARATMSVAAVGQCRIRNSCV